MTTIKIIRQSHIVQLLTVAAVILLAASCASAQQAPKLPMSCVIDIKFEEVEWVGPISGCNLEGGKIEFAGAGGNHTEGNIEYFFENFTITTSKGDKITGHDEGQWDLSTGKFTASGSVTNAPPAWSSLVGAAFNEVGTTTKSAAGETSALGTVMTLK